MLPVSLGGVEIILAHEMGGTELMTSVCRVQLLGRIFFYSPSS